MEEESYTLETLVEAEFFIARVVRIYNIPDQGTWMSYQTLNLDKEEGFYFREGVVNMDMVGRELPEYDVSYDPNTSRYAIKTEKGISNEATAEFLKTKYPDYFIICKETYPLMQCIRYINDEELSKTLFFDILDGKYDNDLLFQPVRGEVKDFKVEPFPEG